jgi:ubiquinone/menaquinone biosynthesis C-methylase UbiE
MSFSLKGFFYKILIDPLVTVIRRSVVTFIRPGDKVIETACGTGLLSVAMAQKADHVTGTDISADMIVTARRTAVRRKVKNISFELIDATDLSLYHDRSFDVAVTSLSMHQFDRDVALRVLKEMKRVAGRIIIADYNCPMEPGISKLLAWGIERIAGGDHYRNFRRYMEDGGIKGLSHDAGLQIRQTKVRGNGVFMIARLSEPENQGYL